MEEFLNKVVDIAVSAGSKIILALLMIAGRLELFTFFMLFSPHYWNPDKA